MLTKAISPISLRLLSTPLVAFLAVLPVIHTYAGGSTANSEPLYKFQELAHVLGEDFTPQRINFEKLGSLWVSELSLQVVFSEASTVQTCTPSSW